ncbi:hypothetical protein HQ520_12440 [bacterium]|nr:hypothetical protein [bacterium]
MNGTLSRGILLGLALLFLNGCVMWDTTSTPRSAVEQLLLSGATDRALSGKRLVAGDQKVYLDTQYLEAYDDKYVVSKVREILGKNGRLVDDRDDADVVVELRSGALAIDRSEFLFGLPAIPLPIPVLDGTAIKTPEIPIFKIVRRRGRAKLALFATSAHTRQQLGSTGTLYGENFFRNWTILGVPFTTSDIWADIENAQDLHEAEMRLDPQESRIARN